MPGLAKRNVQFGSSSDSCSPKGSGGLISSNEIWSKGHDDVSFDQLEKYWNELPYRARRELLRIDKQTLFEQARKNLYCSRCNGLLLEGFSQIVMYGRSLQKEGITSWLRGDPTLYPWGGLVATRDGVLTLLDCFLEGKTLATIQNVFDSARARERERELLYPDACGGGGRGWISQGFVNYGRGHVARDSCALHTARLSCDTLVDFWSALGDETRQSLLKMKEEDFIDRLMYRFDSKRFCRDCRRNVIREFKELKELKRMRREPCCTNWFCVADTAFQYEVTDDSVRADWHQSFTDSAASYHHFEWAIGTGEGKSDILDFEDVGMSGSVQVDDLDLSDLNACYITIRAWKTDGRFTELAVKAHALKGQPCVHRRLVVGDGFVTITKGDDIRNFFEHAEEAEEEEDDDSIEKDGNELDGDGSRPQKHAKSPELAREFLLDAATVIFKEQVEKAFREGTARQNAHSIFVCLALKLLEERIHVACREIITLEKQLKLLEEEEKEKREEEERKERKREREREKKHRRKERLKEKEKEREKHSLRLGKCAQISTKESSSLPDSIKQNDANPTGFNEGKTTLVRTCPSEAIVCQSSNVCTNSNRETLSNDSPKLSSNIGGKISPRDEKISFISEQQKVLRRKIRDRKETSVDSTLKWCDKQELTMYENQDNFLMDPTEQKVHGNSTSTFKNINGNNRQARNNMTKLDMHKCSNFIDPLQLPNCNKLRDKYDSHSCSCHQSDRSKDVNHGSTTFRSVRDTKLSSRSESFYRSNKLNNICYIPDGFSSRGKKITSSPMNRGNVLLTKRVWEPLDSQKKSQRGNLHPDQIPQNEENKKDGNNSYSQVLDESLPHDSAQKTTDESLLCDSTRKTLDESLLCDNVSKTSDESLLCNSAGKTSGESNPDKNLSNTNGLENYLNDTVERKLRDKCPSDSGSTLQKLYTEGTHGGSLSGISTSSSDNCSSYVSEGDSITSSLSTQNAESLSDSEDISHDLEGKDDIDKNKKMELHSHSIGMNFPRNSLPMDLSMKHTCTYNGVRGILDLGFSQNHVFSNHPRNFHVPLFSVPSEIDYYHPSSVPWSSPLTNGSVPFNPSSGYMFPTTPFGYGLSPKQSSHLYTQFNTFVPVVNNQPPIYPTAKNNIVDSRDTNGNCIKFEKECPTKTSVSKKGFEKGDSCTSKSCFPTNNQNFSLFHFGGPISGNNADEILSKEEVNNGDFSSTSSEVSNKRETIIEEYSLFNGGGFLTADFRF